MNFRKEKDTIILETSAFEMLCNEKLFTRNSNSDYFVTPEFKEFLQRTSLFREELREKFNGLATSFRMTTDEFVEFKLRFL